MAKAAGKTSAALVIDLPENVRRIQPVPYPVPTNRQAEAIEKPGSHSGSNEPGANAIPQGPPAERADSLIAIPVTRYYTSDELSDRPELSVALPSSIDRIWPLREPGRGIVTLYIDENAQLDKIRIERSNLPPEFEMLVIEAFGSGAFTAGKLDGRNVKSQVRFEIIFESEAGTNQTFSSNPSVVGN